MIDGGYYRSNSNDTSTRLIYLENYFMYYHGKQNSR